jgi:hypothetical protein
VPRFIPRKALIAYLDAAFNSPFDKLSQLVIVVLLGMGGAGKSQLALEWCRRMRETRKFKAIFWLDASSRPTLHHAMDTVAKNIAPEQSFDDSQASTTFVVETLSGWDDPWLMVFDNLDYPSELRDIKTFFPNARRGFILITSCYAGTKELGHSIELDRMVHEEGHLCTYLETTTHLYYESRQEALPHLDAISSFTEFIAGDIYFSKPIGLLGVFTATTTSLMTQRECSS